MVQISNERVVPNTEVNHTSETLGYLTAVFIAGASVGVNALIHFPNVHEAIPDTHFWEHDGAGLSEYGTALGALVAVTNFLFHHYHGGWTNKTSSKTKHWDETQHKTEVVESDTRWHRNK